MSEAQKKDSDPVSFEKAIETLQLTVKRLESGELPLEEALKAFEQGVQLTRFCQEQLQAAEQKVELLLKSSESGPVLERK